MLLYRVDGLDLKERILALEIGALPNHPLRRDLAKHAFRTLGVVGHHMIIAIFAATIVALFAACMLIYRRSQVQVRFGIVAEDASG